jgi:hypothetical protein
MRIPSVLVTHPHIHTLTNLYLLPTLTIPKDPLFFSIQAYIHNTHVLILDLPSVVRISAHLSGSNRRNRCALSGSNRHNRCAMSGSNRHNIGQCWALTNVTYAHRGQLKEAGLSPLSQKNSHSN